MPAGSEWYRLVAAGGGTYTSPGYFDAIGRLVAVHPMDRYPLVVDVGITKQAALAHWRRETAVIVPATLCAAACLLVLLRALRRQFIRLGRTLAAMHQGLIMVDAGGKVVVCNARAADMLELPAGLLASHPPFAAIAAGSPAAAALNAPGAQAGGVRTCQSPDGGILEMRRIALAGGGFLATFEDVTARRRAEAQVVFLARHDPLTRLPNRAAFVERLEQAVALAGRGSITAVLCLDLDHFKKINDTLGHPVGDLLLREVANRVSACLREVDLVARFGGDEFAVVQFDPKGIDDVALLAQRIIDALSRPFDLDGHQAVISASLGIALVPADGADPDVLLKNADIALYRAKEEGRGTFCFFAAEMDARLQERRRLELDLRHAVQHNEFELHYQPMVNLATQLVCGFEALLRWNHPTRGSLEPAAFIGLVEETGRPLAAGSAGGDQPVGGAIPRSLPGGFGQPGAGGGRAAGRPAGAGNHRGRAAGGRRTGALGPASVARARGADLDG
jgi:diguanylate cyclase (GGDEF)-like protein